MYQKVKPFEEVTMKEISIEALKEYYQREFTGINQRVSRYQEN